MAVSTRNEARRRWFQQPVVWLGIAVFAASIAGCIGMIVLGARHADEPIAVGAEQVFKVPISRPPPKDKP